MKIPNEIRIKRDVTYAILWRDSMGVDYKGRKIYGECNGKEKQIILTIDQSKTESIKTLTHEIFHCIEYEYKIALPHPIICILEEAIYRILKLNGLI
jgi:hypothetical protein